MCLSLKHIRETENCSVTKLEIKIHLVQNEQHKCTCAHKRKNKTHKTLICVTSYCWKTQSIKWAFDVFYSYELFGKKTFLKSILFYKFDIEYFLLFPIFFEIGMQTTNVATTKIWKKSHRRMDNLFTILKHLFHTHICSVHELRNS